MRPDSDHRLFLSYYIIFGMSTAASESRVREWRRVEIGRRRASNYDVSQNPSGGRAVLEPVSAETADDVKARRRLNRAYYRHCVGSHFIQSRPRVGNRGVGQRGQALDGNGCHFLQEFPLHRKIVTRRFAVVRHTVQDAGTFAMKIEGSLKVDDHDVVARN